MTAIVVICGVCGSHNEIPHADSLTAETPVHPQAGEGFECGHCHAQTRIDKCVHKSATWRTRRLTAEDDLLLPEEVWMGYVAPSSLGYCTKCSNRPHTRKEYFLAGSCNCKERP